MGQTLSKDPRQCHLDIKRPDDQEMRMDRPDTNGEP